MKIRDGHSYINGDTTEHEMPSGSVEIIADDGRALLCVTLKEDGTIRIDSGMRCKHGGKMLDSRIFIRPIASNAIEIIRPLYS